MTEEDFYATIKLKTGEEIFAKVAASEEDENILLLVSCPITISEVTGRTGSIMGYKMEPWLKTTTEDLFIVNIEDVITMSESYDIEMISMYQEYCRNWTKPQGKELKISKEMGYLANVHDAKELLEKLYKSS